MSTPTNGPAGYPQGPDHGAPHQGYPQQGYPQQQPPKKRKKWPWVLGILALLALLMFGGCALLVGGALDAADKATSDTGNTSAPDATSTSPAAAQGVGDAIKLSGTATGGASSTYGPLGSASTKDFSGQWAESVTPKNADTYSVTIQDTSGDAAAKVTCKIAKGEKTLDEQSATGAYSVATCTQPLF